MQKRIVFCLCFRAFLIISLSYESEGKQVRFSTSGKESIENFERLRGVEDEGRCTNIQKTKEDCVEEAKNVLKANHHEEELISSFEKGVDNFEEEKADCSVTFEGNDDCMSRENMKENFNIENKQDYDETEDYFIKHQIKSEEKEFTEELHNSKNSQSNVDEKLWAEHSHQKEDFLEASEDFSTRRKNDLKSLKAAEQAANSDAEDVEVDAKSPIQINENQFKFINDEGASATVTDIRSQKEFENFVRNSATSHVVKLVYYYDKEASNDEIQTGFLKIYDAASAFLSPYEISVAKVECGSIHHSRQCAVGRRARFCFGYRGGVQAIAFPLHTVASEDSLVASVLHFAALDVVPIIQSASELRAEQLRCLGECNIFVIQIKSLGSAHHRAVLEAALSVQRTHKSTPSQKSLVFAVATSAQAVVSLPVVTEWEKAWLLQCGALPPCNASVYRGTVSKQHLLQFVSNLQLPLWAMLGKESDHYFYDTKLNEGDEIIQNDISNLHSENWWNEEPRKRKSSPADTSHATNDHVFSSLSNTQHKLSAESLNFKNNEGYQSTNGTFSDDSTSVNASKLMEMFLRSGISLVLLITDGATEQRVDQLAPQLAHLLRGAAGLIVMFMERVPAPVLQRFEVESLTMPTMMFFPPFHTDIQGDMDRVSSVQMFPSAHVVNFEDPLEWVEEQLYMLQPQHPPDSTEGYSPLPHMEELQQDDEVILSMVRESSLAATPRLRGEDDLERKTRHSSSVMAVAYGYSWDASTNVLLQHLSELPLSLTSLRSNATVHRMDCYDHPAACSALPHVPALKFHSGDNALLYNGPLYAAAILRSILILETAWPVVNISEEHASAFLNLTLFPSLKEVVGTTVLGVFLSEKGALDYTRAAEHFRQDILYAVTYATEENARKWCLHSSSHSSSNCLIIVKRDQLKNRIILRDLPSNSDAIIKLLEKATLNSLEKLQPHRLMGFLSSSRERRKKSAFVVLLLAHGEDVNAVKNKNHNFVSNKEPDNARTSSTFKQNIDISTPKLGQCVVDKCREEKRSHEPETISSPALEEVEPPHDRHEFSDQLKFGGATGKSEALVGSELFVSVGHVANKMTSDEMMFSWIPKNSSLAETALSAWRCPRTTSLVGLDVVASKVFCGGTYSSDAAVLGWVQDLLHGRLSETGELSPTRWRPLLNGLDYLRLLEEEEEEGSNFQA